MASAINDKGQVVGFSGIPGPSMHAFLYQNGSMINLNSLLDPNSNVNLIDALSINDSGQILVIGNTIGDDRQRLYLLTLDGQPQPIAPDTLLQPVPEPSTLAFFAVASLSLAARCHVRRRGARTKV